MIKFFNDEEGNTTGLTPIKAICMCIFILFILFEQYYRQS